VPFQGAKDRVSSKVFQSGTMDYTWMDKDNNNSLLVNFAELRELFHDLPLEIIMYDLQGRIRFVNHYFESDEQIRKEMIGQDDDYYFKLKGIRREAILIRRVFFQRAIKEKRLIKFTEKLHFENEDRTLYYKRYYRPVFFKDGSKEVSHVFLFGSNLSATVLGQKELRYLAYHDKLTGLKNREALNEFMKQMESESEKNPYLQRQALLYVDLDNFKFINESLGHTVADLLLQEVASRLNICIEKSDQIYRYGSDEFIIILKSISQDYDAGRTAERITKYLSKPYLIQNQRITSVSSSIGIAMFPKDGKNIETLLKNADTAMYSAKKNGKNNFQYFSKALTEYSVRRLRIEKHLIELVHKNDYERQFRILYQPIVEKKTHGEYKVIGAEALLRWKNHELGFVLPDAFIPIAEEADLISKIGEWIFYKTCTEYKNLNHSSESPLVLSINFSAKQLKSPRVVQKIEEILKSTNFNPEQLQLELTETSYLDEHPEVVTNIQAIGEMGIRIALDDFGVGFASLSYLHKVPASTIKIDRSFIRYLSTSPRHKELVKTIIMLGKNMHKDVVAEGVEQVEDLYLLDTHKCYKYQGYLFSKPVDLDEFRKILKKESLLTTIIS
jgi:diguanylate cyclase (GGDEF)-like protein